MKITEKRKAGEMLERGGIAQRIIDLATAISQGTYKEAMENAGRITELVAAATYDEYWTEKVNIGQHKEQFILESISSGRLDRNKVLGVVNPIP